MYLVHASRIDGVWEEVLPFLLDACEFNGGIDTPMDIYKLLLKERKFLWLYYEESLQGIVITSIELYPLKKICWVDICTGKNLDNGLKHLPLIEEWGKAQGCDKMFILARPGYERKLSYRKKYVFLEKNL